MPWDDDTTDDCTPTSSALDRECEQLEARLRGLALGASMLAGQMQRIADQIGPTVALPGADRDEWRDHPHLSLGMDPEDLIAACRVIAAWQTDPAAPRMVARFVADFRDARMEGRA
jgi:hypothetical protein